MRALRTKLFDTRNGAFIAPLFSAYTEWFETYRLPALSSPGIKVQRGVLPGDLGLVIGPPHLPFKLGVVGLNSAWTSRWTCGRSTGRRCAPSCTSGFRWRARPTDPRDLLRATLPFNVC